MQAAGSKRGRDGDEVDMSTEDDLEVVVKVVKKTSATKKRCANLGTFGCESLNLENLGIFRELQNQLNLDKLRYF